MDYNTFIGIIKEAANGLRVVRFDYTKKDGTTNTYEVEPYKVEGVYVWARKTTEPSGTGIRKFFIENVENIRILETVYVPCWDVEI